MMDAEFESSLFVIHDISGGVPKIGVPKFAGWFIMEHPFKWMIWGVPPILGNPHI